MPILLTTRQAATAVIALTLLALLVLPAMALASEAGTSEGRAERTPPPHQHLPADGAACEPLVTFTATRTTGDARAVAITAQAIEQGVEGWSMVAWEVADGTQVTSLTIVDADGRTETRIEGIERGHAEDVLELRFCGSASPGETHDPGEVADDETETGTASSAHPRAEPADASADEAPNPDADEASNPDAGEVEAQVGERKEDPTTVAAETSEATDATPPETAQPERTGTQAAVATQRGNAPGATATDGAAAEDATDGASAAATTDADDQGAPGDAVPDVEPAGDTEVLGVQLARTGGEVAPLTAWGAIGTLAGATVLLTGRRRCHQGGRHHQGGRA
jgi:hypothetical protein